MWIASVISAGSLALAWGLVVWATGGVFGCGGRAHPSRDALRPSVIGALLAVAAWLAPAGEWRRQVVWATAAIDRHAAGGAIAAALTLLVVALGLGVHVAGGADGYGYVSQSALWQAGASRPVETAMARVAGERIEVAPLGYGPSVVPGRPLHVLAGPAMAHGTGARAVRRGGAIPCHAGAWRAHRVALFQYVRQRAGPTAGVAAAWLLAASPPFAFQTP
ncbi:MAG: hypothetical protein R2712_30870 [Vicinamibacterales bacterium]